MGFVSHEAREMSLEGTQKAMYMDWRSQTLEDMNHARKCRRPPLLFRPTRFLERRCPGVLVLLAGAC